MRAGGRHFAEVLGMKNLAIGLKALWMGTAVLAVLLTAAPARANVILNGSFEAGDFTDWIAVPDPVDSQFFVSGNPYSGTFAAWFGAVGIVDETITQTFATDPGRHYQIDFWLAHGATNTENDFNVYWNGSPIFNILDAGSFGYTHYTFVETALGPTSTLQFAGREVLDYFFLDDVTVVAMPEPATLMLVGAGLGTMRARRRRESGARQNA